MKNLLTLIISLFGATAYAQFPVTQTLGSPTTIVKSKGAFKADTLFVNAVYPDTIKANTNPSLKAYPGGQIFTTSDNSVWYRNATATGWIKYSSGAGSAGWGLTGNAGTNPANFLGTTDSTDFSISTNNTRRILLSGAGNVGINQTSPTYKLDVSGTGQFTKLLKLGDVDNIYNDVYSQKLQITSLITNPPSSSNIFNTLSHLNVGYTSTNSNRLNVGMQSIAFVKETNTADWTNPSYPQLAGFSTTVQSLSGSSGTIRKVAGMFSTVAGPFPAGTGATLDEAIYFCGDAANSGINYLVGAKFTDLNKGINNTGVYLGMSQSTYPSTGNWGIYDNTGYSSYFGGSVGLGSAMIAPTAKLDITDTARGLLIPRMTTTQRNAIVSPASSLMIFNTTTNKHEYYDAVAVAWASMGGGSAAGSNYELQYNNAGAFGASPNLYYDNSVNSLRIGKKNNSGGDYSFSLFAPKDKILGTVSTTTGSGTVTGVGTTFLTSFMVSDLVTVNEETRQILSIASNTSLTTVVWTGTNTGASYTRSYYSSGTITVTAGSGTVTGAFNTAFRQDFAIGDTISANGETRVISAITSNNVMVTDNWTSSGSLLLYTTNNPKRVITAMANGMVSIGNGKASVEGTNPYILQVTKNMVNGSFSAGVNIDMQNILNADAPTTNVGMPGIISIPIIGAKNTRDWTGNLGLTGGNFGSTIVSGATGTISNQNSIALDLRQTSATSTTTNAKFVNVGNSFANAGTITNTYGVYVADISTGIQTNKPYSFYASDVNTNNYFAGSTLIGSATIPNSSSLFTVTSTTQGSISAPVMTQTQMVAISSPATGLEIYNTTTNTKNIFNGTNWTGGLTASSAATLTLIHGQDYVFTGVTSTWTLPAVSATLLGRGNSITIKNRGTGAITLNSNAGNTIYSSAAVGTFTISPGEAIMLMPDGTFFNIE